MAENTSKKPVAASVIVILMGLYFVYDGFKQLMKGYDMTFFGIALLICGVVLIAVAIFMLCKKPKAPDDKINNNHYFVFKTKVILKRSMFFSILLFSIVSAISCGNNATNEEFNAVDLGLPSGCLWADMNLGAKSIEDHGSFFFWGDPNPCDVGSRYKYVNDYYYTGGGESQYLKYVTYSQYGIVDNKDILDNDDDAAFIASGGKWVTPTEADIDELLTYCKWEETEMNGKPGIKFIGPNGNSIFLPNPGDYNTLLYTLNEGIGSRYWTNTACHSSPNYSWTANGEELVTWSIDEALGENFAFGLAFSVTYKGIEVKKHYEYRASSAMIRPVCHKLTSSKK